MSPSGTPTPSQAGRTFVVTGANSGLGFFTSEQLAAAGAHVVLACRSAERADAAIAAIRGRVPGASLGFQPIDLSDLASVRSAVADLERLDRIDGLIANAGIVHPPRHRATTVDGNELVVGTNYLGHFALVNALLPTLEHAPDARVVLLGSMISRLLDSDLSDLQLEDGYERWRAYANSKIAMQVFGFELNRRLSGGGWSTRAMVVHPGYSISGRTPRVPGVNEPTLGTRIADGAQALWAQGKHRGARSIVRAATDPTLKGGEYIGPALLTRGRPSIQRPTRTSTDSALAVRLWAQSERAVARRR